VATEAEFTAAMQAVEDVVNDLAKWLGQSGIELKNFGDPRAHRIAAIMTGCGKAAAALTGAVQNLSSVTRTIVEGSTERPPYEGTATFDWGTAVAGVATSDQVVIDGGGNSVSLWLASDSIIIPYMSHSVAGSGGDEDYFFYPMLATVTVGVGFDFKIWNPGTPTAQEYTLKWFAWP
jgi:hypothetical protein